MKERAQERAGWISRQRQRGVRRRGNAPCPRKQRGTKAAACRKCRPLPLTLHRAVTRILSFSVTFVIALLTHIFLGVVLLIFVWQLSGAVLFPSAPPRIRKGLVSVIQLPVCSPMRLDDALKEALSVLKEAHGYHAKMAGLARASSFRN